MSLSNSRLLGWCREEAGAPSYSLSSSGLPSQPAFPNPRSRTLGLPSSQACRGLSEDFLSVEIISLGNSFYVGTWWVSPLGKALSWLPPVSSSPERVPRPSLCTQYLGASLSSAVWPLGGQVEAAGELCRGSLGSRSPGP